MKRITNGSGYIIAWCLFIAAMLTMVIWLMIALGRSRAEVYMAPKVETEVEVGVWSCRRCGRNSDNSKVCTWCGCLGRMDKLDIK